MYRLINVVRLDREVTKTVHFKVICTDNVQLQGQIGARIMTGSAIVRIVIKDKNDMAPEFTSHPYNFELPEGEPELGYDRRYSLGRVVARDRDEGVNAELTYSIVPGNPLNHHFVIDSRTGALYAVQSFDRETIKSVSLLVQVVDGGKENVHTASVDVKIEIVDKNDCAPQFQLSNNQMEVEENVLNGRVGHLLATDMDDNANFKKIIYRLENSLDGSHFIIDSQSGDIRVRGRLDRETRNHYEFKVFAIDNPDGQLSDQNTGTATVIVTVLDQNDNAPVFEYPSDNKKIILRSDESTAGITAFKAKATDADAGNNSTVNYMLEYGGNGIFKMEKVMGICYLNKAPSANSPRSYSLRIRAYDLGTPRSLNSSITVTVVFSQNEVGKYAGEGDFRDDQIDRTIVIVSVTIFLLLLVSTFILVVLIRYRHLFSRGGTRGYRPGHKATVISRCQKAEDDAKTLRSDTYRKTQTALLSPDSTQDEQEDPTYGNRASDIKNSLLPSRWNGDIVGSFLKLSDIDSKNPGNAERMVLANRQHSHFASGENYQTLDAVVSPRGYSPASDDFLATSGPAGLCIANSHTMTPGRDARKNYYYEVATTGSPFRRVHMKQNSLSGGSTGPPSNPYQIYGINSETSQTPSHQSSVGDSATYGRSPKCYVFNNTGSPCLTSKPKVEDSFV